MSPPVTPALFVCFLLFSASVPSFAPILSLSSRISSWAPFLLPYKLCFTTSLSPGQAGRKHRESATDFVLYLLWNHWVHSISQFPVCLLQTHIFFFYRFEEGQCSSNNPPTFTWLGNIRPLLCFPSQTQRKRAATFSSLIQSELQTLKQKGKQCFCCWSTFGQNTHKFFGLVMRLPKLRAHPASWPYSPGVLFH